MQATLQNRFGGDVGLFTNAFEKLERILSKPGKPMYDKVGNNCLVFFTNDEAKKVCQANPETLQGVIIDDYWSTIHPNALVIGSFFRGSIGTAATAGPGSKIFYSNVVMANVRDSRVERSEVNVGSVEGCTITDSLVSGSLGAMMVARSWVQVGHIAGEHVEDQILGLAARDDHDDANGHVAAMLAKRGLHAGAVQI